MQCQAKFLSTLSLRRATVTVLGIQHKVGISIHALLAESDTNPSVSFKTASDFYPRSPCGERPPRGGSCYLDNIISIHALLAESDRAPPYNLMIHYISIHALLAESDKLTAYLNGQPHDFYPRSPCGERRVNAGREYDTEENFYPRSPCGERRKYHTVDRVRAYISIHALLAESDSW